MSNPPEPTDPVEFDSLPDDDDKPKRGIPDDGYRWHEVWSMVLASPGVETFERILVAPGVSRGRAFTWLFMSFVLGFGIALARIWSYLEYPWTTALMWLLLSLVLALAMFINSSVMQLAARLLGGVGTNREFVFSFAAFTAPLFIIRILVSMVAIHPVFDWAIMTYELLLTIMALKAVNRFGWLRAIVAMALARMAAWLVAMMIINTILEWMMR